MNKKYNLKKIIKEKILNGLYPPGSKIDSELKLQKQHNISRVTVRGCLEELKNENIINSQRGSGSYISDDALDIIKRLRGATVLRSAFVMPQNRFYNPVFRNIFNAYRQNIEETVDSYVYFHNLLKLETYINDSIDILIVDESYGQKAIEQISESVKNIIVVGESTDYDNYICFDNFSGGYMAAEFLIKNGHRNIIPLDISGSFGPRVSGIMKAFADYKIEFDTGLFHELGSSDIYQAMNHIIKATNKFTAVIALSDTCAVKVYEAIEDNGLKIPDEISVMGYDDQGYCQFTTPPLTTINQPTGIAGERLAVAVNNLLNDDLLSITERIKPLLVRRESVKAIG
jgi:DNA-binding LacI/PurR family transcriptional regulator